ncbi:CDP-alcohol phosphatidyltransferase family protein [Sungkyunkwania multivorans]|uniref:CDP-alcohol phosphatidyltransferase family protein n=1 Tax=Sungkyunkwania multivorans TaxID=1173618 RepID=A0ABW3D251_9FLAO
MKKHIPNLITLLNLFCGCIAVVFAASDELIIAAFFVFLGIFFDFFDGLAARKLKVQSELGLQLDSLADMVTSGLVPGLVMFQLLSSVEGVVGLSIVNSVGEFTQWRGFKVGLLPFIGFLITLASAYRLANFNIDERQTTSFIGLPTPANALLVLSLPLILEFQSNDLFRDIILNKWFLIGMTLLSSFLLNANLPLFALKFKTWGFKENAIRYIFLIACVLLLALLQFVAIPLIILLYVLMSLFDKTSNTQHPIPKNGL